MDIKASKKERMQERKKECKKERKKGGNNNGYLSVNKRKRLLTHELSEE